MTTRGHPTHGEKISRRILLSGLNPMPWTKQQLIPHIRITSQRCGTECMSVEMSLGNIRTTTQTDMANRKESILIIKKRKLPDRRTSDDRAGFSRRRRLSLASIFLVQLDCQNRTEINHEEQRHKPYGENHKYLSSRPDGPSLGVRTISKF